MSGQPNPRVGLFVTCLVDAIRPSIGFPAIQLLEEAGCRVEVPQSQTCCGQPALNSGDEKDAAALARQTIAAFEGFDSIVLPSGSCAGTIVHGYPDLLAKDPVWAPRARILAAATGGETMSVVSPCEGVTISQDDFETVLRRHLAARTPPGCASAARRAACCSL